MTKTKSTKRALLTSALALLMCVSMLIGSTFAWFTDSVTSAGNTIQSGTLKVDLVDAQGNSLEGKVLEFVDQDENDLWEPGCTYNLQEVYVANKGNLALKYEIVINGIDGNAKLLEAIEWTVTVDGTTTELADLKGYLLAGETSKAIVLSGHMKKEAGNEYQGLTAEGISIAVFATQYTHESDSFNNQYDANAEYAAQTMLKKVAAVAAGESATVKLEGDGYVLLNNASPIGAKVVGDVTVDLNGKTLFVKVEDGNAHMSLFNIIRGGKLTVTGNGTIEMLTGANPLVTAIFNNTSGTLVIENGTYKMDNPANWEDALIPTLIDNNGNAAGATTIINDGNFYHTRNMFRNFPSNNGITQLTINGGTFNGKADDWAAIWNQKASSSTNEGQSLITINGGEFNYVEINNEFETGVTIAPDAVIPVVISTTDELIAAIKDAPVDETTYIALADGTYSEDMEITVAALGQSGGDVVIKAAKGANPVISGTVTLGYRNQGVGATMYNANVTFEGITFDHASAANHSLDIQDVKSLTLKNCTIIGDGEYGISSARGNGTGASKIVGCTFENAGMQLLGNFATGLVIDDCVFNESCINIQAGNGVTVQNCEFNKTLTAANVGDSFYAIRSNSTPITVKNCEINVDSELTEVATAQAKWYLLANRGTTNWTVENVEVTLTDAALAQTALVVTACTSTGTINATNLTVNGVQQ